MNTSLYKTKVNTYINIVKQILQLIKKGCVMNASLHKNKGTYKNMQTDPSASENGAVYNEYFTI